MKTLFSLIIRAICLAGVALIAFLFSIPVGMGFDSGVQILPVLFACIYVFTFLPSIIIFFVPLKSLIKPNMFLKIWYGWIITISSVFAIGRVYNFGDSIVSIVTDNSIISKVCFIVDEAELKKLNRESPYVDISIDGSDPRRYKPAHKICYRINLAEKPRSSFMTYVYSKNNRNATNNKAAETDIKSNIVYGKFIADGYSCVFIKPEKMSEINKAGWSIRSEECDSSMDPNSFMNSIRRAYFNN